MNKIQKAFSLATTLAILAMPAVTHAAVKVKQTNRNTGNSSTNTNTTTITKTTTTTTSNVASVTNVVVFGVNTGGNSSIGNTSGGDVDSGNADISLRITNTVN